METLMNIVFALAIIALIVLVVMFGNKRRNY